MGEACRLALSESTLALRLKTLSFNSSFLLLQDVVMVEQRSKEQRQIVRLQIVRFITVWKFWGIKKDVPHDTDDVRYTLCYLFTSNLYSPSRLLPS